MKTIRLIFSAVLTIAVNINTPAAGQAAETSAGLDFRNYEYDDEGIVMLRAELNR